MKSETRMTKSEPRLSPSARVAPKARPFVIRASSFVIDSDFWFRHSSFVIPSVHTRLASTVLRALEHRVADVLRLQRITERRWAGLALSRGIQEIRHLVDERVLVAD